MKKMAVLMVVISSCFLGQVVMADMGRVSSIERKIQKNVSPISVSVKSHMKWEDKLFSPNIKS